MSKTLAQIKKGKPNQGYIVFDDKSKNTVLSTYGNTIDSFDGVARSPDLREDRTTAANSSNPSNLRYPYYPGTYERLRPWEMTRNSFKDIISQCRSLYIKIGTVRNVIDLMTDFVCEDLKIIHADKGVEAFFKVWRSKVNLLDVVSEFARHLLVDGNVVVKRNTAVLTKPVQTQWMKAIAADKMYVEDATLKKREIPIRYTFINVAALEWTNGAGSTPYQNRTLGFRVNSGQVKQMSSETDPFGLRMYNSIPSDLRDSLLSGKTQNGLVLVDMKKVFFSCSKKDSWEDWAPPFLFAVLPDIQFKEKLRHAERSALDGIINAIRIWKLGDHTEKILPTEDAIAKLIGILQNNTGGGTVDIVWDSMIELQDSYPPIDKILGPEKFLEVDRDISIGLGIPEVLLGGKGANFSNSFIQLKTIVERLKFIRRKIVDWLDTEIGLICNSMGIETRPKVSFGMMNLEDANANRKLIVGLLDRGAISVEAVLDAYGEDFMIEIERIKEENKTFEDADIHLRSPYKSDESQDAAPGGGKGRQPGTPDSSTRKTRVAKPRQGFATTKAILGYEVISAIEDQIIVSYMEELGVSNARKLNNDQKEEIDNIRVLALSCINTEEDLSKIDVLEYTDYDKVLFHKLKDAVVEYINDTGKMPTLEQKKRIYALTWGQYHG